MHNDAEAAVNRSDYSRFLVESPIPSAPITDASANTDEDSLACAGGENPITHGGDCDDAWPGSFNLPFDVPGFTGFGTFHQQYRIDGKLVAVGIVDVLPGCLSSKYLFWDPDYAFLELGKVSALVEMAFVVQAKSKLARNVPASGVVRMRHYYQGYYLHTCPKMVYKSQYKPCEMLCPACLSWISFDAALKERFDASNGHLESLCASPAECKSRQAQAQARGIDSLPSPGDESKVLVDSDAVDDVLIAVRHPDGRLFLRKYRDIKKAIPLQEEVAQRIAEWISSCGPSLAKQIAYHF